MEQTEYTLRRKLQNREAQRRYRQRQKELATGEEPLQNPQPGRILMDMQDNTVFREVTFPASTTRTAKSSEISTTESGTGNTEGTDCASNLDTWFSIPNGNDLDSDASFAAGDLIQAYGMSEDVSMQSTHQDTIDDNCRGSKSNDNEPKDIGEAFILKSMPRSYAKFHSEIMEMSDEILRAFTFGVEMQLVETDEDLMRQITAMKENFSRLIHEAARTDSSI